MPSSSSTSSWLVVIQRLVLLALERHRALPSRRRILPLYSHRTPRRSLTAVGKQNESLLLFHNNNGGRVLARLRRTLPSCLPHCGSATTTAKASFSTATAAPPPPEQPIIGSSSPGWVGYRIINVNQGEQMSDDDDEKKDPQPLKPLEAVCSPTARDTTTTTTNLEAEEEDPSTVSLPDNDDGGPLSSTMQKNATIELKNFLERHVGAWRSSVEFRRIRVLYGNAVDDETTTKNDDDETETTTNDDNDESTTKEEEQEQESGGGGGSKTKKKKKKRKVGWSAVFTCPATNVTVSSKTLRTTKNGFYNEAPIAAHYLDHKALATAMFFEPQQKKRKQNNKKISDQDIIDDQGTTIHSLVLYNSWQQAKHAAAGAYLDAVQYNGNTAQPGIIEPRYCVELPSPIRIGIPQSEEEQGVMVRRRIIMGDKTLPALPWDQMNGPLVMLNTAFRYFYDRRYRPGALVTVTTTTVTDAVWEGYSSTDNNNNNGEDGCEDGGEDGGEDGDETDATTTTGAAPPVRKDILWHAIFTCPVTGTQFPSSVYRDQINYYNSNNNNIKVVRYCQRDGLVHYSYKKEAINAAAARFFDALAYRMGIDDQPYDTSMRLCQDDPAILGDKLYIVHDERDKPHEAIAERVN